jgi:hypothetical protein
MEHKRAAEQDHPEARPIKQLKVRKNKPRNTDKPEKWGDAVWKAFETKINNNLTSKNRTYYEPFVPRGVELPPVLAADPCQIPTGSNNIMVCVNDQEYQRPIHRIRMLLKARGLRSAQQASHLCMDAINVDGRGEKHCRNPSHMVVEDDKTNKSRQRCAGWIWIHPFQDQPGGYWYPSCVHEPQCLRFTPKTKVPTALRRDFVEQ